MKNGISEKKATKIFDLMEHFAGYGFNKSHSTTYALLAYQTAYLKANYPWHFASALLTIESQNTDKIALYLGECRDRGIPVLPPDINESALAFTVTPGGVRFGLIAIKNVGQGAIESMLRGTRGPRRAVQTRSTSSARTSTCASSTSACSRRSSGEARSIHWAPVRQVRGLQARWVQVPRVRQVPGCACFGPG